MSSETKQNISRRKFFGLAGTAATVAAVASIGAKQGWTCKSDEEEVLLDKGNITYKTDVLVIGGGMAGLFAAVKAHDAGAKVVVVSKGGFGTSGQTPFAKGIFEFDAIKSKYNVDEFVEKVNYSALGTNNPAYTRQMAKHSQARVEELRQWGFFDETLCRNAFLKPIKERNIPVIERVTITHLIKEDKQLKGTAGFSVDEHKGYIFNAKSIILCTGAGGFKPNGFPICDLTHDGTIMAYEIGAKVTGKEWNDGHPGKANNAAACFDGWGNMFTQKPTTTGVSIRHDLGVDLNYQAYVSGNPVNMRGPGKTTNTGNSHGPYRPSGISMEMPQKDHKQGPPDKKRQGPPKGGEGRPPKDKDKGQGGPPGMGGTSVGGSSAGMAIHKSEGLVPINTKCESNIKGLYAAGDALGSYMSGAIYTQIGSSLAGSAVQGAIAGEEAAKHSSNKVSLKISKLKELQITKEIFAPLKRESGYSPAYVSQTLQGIMIPNFVLYVKKERMMKAALAYVEELRDHHMPLLRAADMHELRLAHETRNMIISAEMKLKASIMRTESRCSHYRLDYPNLDNENWNAWINIFKGKDGTMQFEKQKFINKV